MSKRDYLFQKGGKDSRRGRRESFLLLLGEPRRGSRHNSELEEGKGLGCLGKGGRVPSGTKRAKGVFTVLYGTGGEGERE